MDAKTDDILVSWNPMVTNLEASQMSGRLLKALPLLGYPYVAERLRTLPLLGYPCSRPTGRLK